MSSRNHMRRRHKNYWKTFNKKADKCASYCKVFFVDKSFKGSKRLYDHIPYFCENFGEKMIPTPTRLRMHLYALHMYCWKHFLEIKSDFVLRQRKCYDRLEWFLQSYIPKFKLK
ncbi:unnamed protein product [Moneuplotes crassus]|uniref:Uncharacterized protein n=1 Tax=Euplotes crassus TaxID=5936 RepID=A0AAD2DA44_EUPCR|nr:unnamed protein product [Moneuplotes crassus]